MAHLERAVATLRVAGDHLDPEEVTLRLGAQPTHSQRNGQEFRFKSGRTRVAKFGQWRLVAPDTEPEDLDHQVAELLGTLTNDLEIWRDLSSRFNVDLFCGWFMGRSNEGLTISPATLLRLGERGIELAIDIYAPETDA